MVSTCMLTVADRLGLTLASEGQERERSSRVIKGHQGSSRVIKGHQGQSSVIKGHQGQSSVIKDHQVYSPSSLPSAERERSIAEAPAKIESKMFLMREAIRGRHQSIRIHQGPDEGGNQRPSQA